MISGYLWKWGVPRTYYAFLAFFHGEDDDEPPIFESTDPFHPFSSLNSANPRPSKSKPTGCCRVRAKGAPKPSHPCWPEMGQNVIPKWLEETETLICGFKKTHGFLKRFVPSSTSVNAEHASRNKMYSRSAEEVNGTEDLGKKCCSPLTPGSFAMDSIAAFAWVNDRSGVGQFSPCTFRHVAKIPTEGTKGFGSKPSKLRYLVTIGLHPRQYIPCQYIYIYYIYLYIYDIPKAGQSWSRARWASRQAKITVAPASAKA